MPADSEGLSGGEEMLIVSMDIGTVYTAVSFAHFCPGFQTRTRVTRFPRMSECGTATKIPTIVSYRDGSAKACGIEAINDLDEDASSAAVRFKLHLHPPHMRHPTAGSTLSNLPSGVTVKRAYSDMMQYVMEKTRIFFENTTPNGAEIWSRLRETMAIVLTIPNGWGSREQAVLHDAAVMAGLVTESAAASLIHFLTEDEASLHFVLSDRTNAWLEKDMTFAVTDAGASTANIAIYQCRSLDPLELTEVCAGECLPAGSIFVDHEVKKILSSRNDLPLDRPGALKSMLENFEKIKPTFDGSSASYALRFNGPITNSNTRRIGGYLTGIKNKMTRHQDIRVVKNEVSLLKGELIRAYDEAERIGDACARLCTTSNPKYLFLTGGFAGSTYFQSVLSDKLNALGTKVISPSDCPEKAVAEGATIWYIEQLVKERATKPTLGIEEMHAKLGKFVLSMDIGTSQTSVSYTHIPPGGPPQTGTTPSIVSYRNGKVTCGQEAVKDLEEDDSNVAYHFKLHLHPPAMARDSGLEVPKLPPGTTITRVYADMMAYLMENTRRFYEENTSDGVQIWSRLRDTMVIVFSTPNGWDLREQDILRKAALMAELVTEETAAELVQFVTEAEASVYVALDNQPKSWLKKDTVFAVVDAGGSTVDITIYECTSTDPVELREVCDAEVLKLAQAGGIYVDSEVGKAVSAKIRGSKYDRPASIRKMVDAFERDVKPKFDGTLRPYSLKFGSPWDNDRKFGIARGTLSLQGQEIVKAYSTVEKRIVETCSDRMNGRNVESLHLLGGFGRSPYLQKVLSDRLGAEGITVKVMEGAASMAGDPRLQIAAAEAVTVSYINQLVKARAARATVGTSILRHYNPHLHRERSHLVFTHYDGRRVVPGGFDAWVKKGAILEDNFAHESTYSHLLDATSMTLAELKRELGVMEVEVLAWEGPDVPMWCTNKNKVMLAGMKPLCTLKADLSAVAPSLKPKMGSHGKKYYEALVTVHVFFGGTQLRAELRWEENGIPRKGPVAVIPHVTEEVVTRQD